MSKDISKKEVKRNPYADLAVIYNEEVHRGEPRGDVRVGKRDNSTSGEVEEHSISGARVRQVD